ncbi:uncharacterized protein LOC118280486 [Spodoptera frugiperda]|uniref:Uncharacterized protein LOC118280486 n=1 Tax=Spodoptera frugiperda TaxID=7108 RepID=A0A9R0E3L3_SPOFR|nr:uncharacterized protein LOC118280486 [Spodoptera frugiperda]
MISAKNRVQQIKSKFENLNNTENIPNKRIENQLFLNKNAFTNSYGKENSENIEYELSDKTGIDNESESDDWTPTPNSSYLYNKIEVKRSTSDTKNSLSRQSSDPGKKLHRSHAFRCDRSQKIANSPKRHGSCNGRSETSDFSFKMERKLSKDRLKRLGNFLEEQMRKENYVPQVQYAEIVGEVKDAEQFDSIPDSEVPQHILDQYAIVVKPKRQEREKQEAMTDSGVSSETENVEEDKNGRIKRLLSQFEKSPEKTHLTNLQAMDDLCDSSETIRLERKNPHLKLTDTLKKALKQPLPAGPPPAKPPRVLKPQSPQPQPETTDEQKKEAKRMLEKLELVLQKREGTVETPKKPKEIHYLCTEILDITNRTLLPNQTSDPISRCLNSLNCAIKNNSTSSLPYTRLKTNEDTKNLCCACTSENKDPKWPNKCLRCTDEDEKVGRFKCHVNCVCDVKNSKFYVHNEHIYDVPCMEEDPKHTYGTINTLKSCKSMEELRSKKSEDSKIYDIPYEPMMRPPTPEIALLSPKPTIETAETVQNPPKTDFAKLRQNFENGFPMLEQKKPTPIKPKPILVSKFKTGKSIENLNGEFLRNPGKYHTDHRRYKNKADMGISFTLPKRDTQLDLDRENLNDLMNELFETVTAVCNMDDNKPGSFPTENSDGSTSEESVKLTRSLTEKRKNYVRRVSTRVAYLDPKNIKRFRHQTSICSYKSEVIDNPYSTFRSWKSFRTSQGNITKMDTASKFNLTDADGNVLSMKDVLDASSDSIDNMSIDEKAGCIDLPFEPRERGLFNLCLLVGLNHMTGQAYVKSVFPSQVQVPPHIENLVFPETMSSSPRSEWSVDARSLQCYSLVLTDERGERAYGYCRRVLPEGATTCLPLCYCLIGRYRAPGFYYKVLEEIESHHGSSDVEIHSILQQLFETDFPNPGEEITISYAKNNDYDIPGDYESPNGDYNVPSGDYNVSPKSKTLPDLRREEKSEMATFYDLENNNGVKNFNVTFDNMLRTKIIKRPIEPRVDEDNMSVLLDLLGAGLVIKVFGSLLLERKVIIIGDQLRSVSSCVEALQASLYPFVWQQPLISSIPMEIQREVLEAPLPILAGMLHPPHDSDLSSVVFEEGMLIDLTHPSKVLYYQGDESTILPTSCYKTLKTALQMETSKNKDREQDIKTRNLMISEAFLRFFVDILGDFWRFFHLGEVKDGDLGRNGVVFDKEAFIKSSTSKQNQYFLEWFTETAMFTHFIQNMSSIHHSKVTPNSPPDLVDTPLPNYYGLFDERVRSRTKSSSKSVDSSRSNYKNVVNKKVKFLKSKLRDLVA